MRWRDSATFKFIDLEDSFVLSWHVFNYSLVFELEFSLWPGHSKYEKPDNDEYTCYKIGTLEFQNIGKLIGLLEMNEAPSTTESDGSVDYGCIEQLEWTDEGSVKLTGDFGEVGFTASSIRIHI